MKVKELIKALKKMDQEAMVVVCGYEGGLSEAKDPKEILIDLNVTPNVWYYGPHEEAEDLGGYRDAALAVYLSR